jgi:integrase
LRRVFNLAIGDGLIATSPFGKGTASVKLAKENNERVRFLTVEEERKLREVLDPVDWLAVVFALTTGLRQGEQFTARWEHVDFDNLNLTVPRSKHGELRHVPLSPDAVETLLALRRRAGLSPWVFPSEVLTTHQDAANFATRIFRPALEAAGVENFRWHDLRHTFGSRLAMAGVPLYVIQRLMGHKSDRMTQRYAHLDASCLRDAVSKFRLASTKTDTEHDAPTQH